MPAGELRCALAVLPTRGGDPGRLLRSLQAAIRHGAGDFFRVEALPSEGADLWAALKDAAVRAAAEDVDWLLAVTDAETLRPDIFAKTAPALRLHDAVWGGADLAATGRQERITRLAAQDLAGLFHAALAWWIGPAHFVRPPLALAALQDVTSASPLADYWLRLWNAGRAYKTAQSLTSFHADLPLLSEADRAALVRHLEREPVFMPIGPSASPLFLPYTGVNPVIEREQARGLFFEQDELEYLAGALPAGARILDVGANTGNHTIFFAGRMHAARVVPVEPLPRAAAAIRAAVARNDLGNVDLSKLGIAAGAGPGRLRPVASAAGGLGATRFEADPDGPVPVMPLDRLADGPVDLLKIDVEGMEMEVLAGAAALLARDRPLIHVEVLDAGIGRFLAWADESAYRVRKLFPDKTHCNYVLVPAERETGWAG